LIIFLNLEEEIKKKFEYLNIENLNIEFEYFELMDNIFGKKKDANQNYIVSSKVCSEIEKPSTSQSARKRSSKSAANTQHFEEENSYKSSRSSQTHTQKSSVDQLPLLGDVTSTDSKHQKCLLHGTGSKTAKIKIELEKQWLHHLTMKQERDRKKDEKHTALIDNKREAIKLKKKQLILKEQELQQRREIADKKLKKKKILHTEILEIEKLKYKVLKRYLNNKENVKIVSSDGC